MLYFYDLNLHQINAIIIQKTIIIAYHFIPKPNIFIATSDSSSFKFNSGNSTVFILSFHPFLLLFYKITYKVILYSYFNILFNN